MPVEMRTLVAVRFSVQDGFERHKSIEQASKECPQWDATQKALAGVYRTLFLKANAFDTPTREQLKAVEFWQKKGADLSPQAVDSFIDQFGLAGRYPRWMIKPQPREDIYLDLWALRDIEVRNKLPQHNWTEFSQEAENWINTFAVRLINRSNKNSYPSDETDFYV